MFYTLPLIYSYFSFIYDNYSDIQLSYNYYKASYDDNHTTLGPNSSSCSIPLPIDGQVAEALHPLLRYFPKKVMTILSSPKLVIYA